MLVVSSDDEEVMEESVGEEGGGREFFLGVSMRKYVLVPTLNTQVAN